MKCLKIPRRYLIYCFGLLLSVFFTLSFCCSSTHAVSDLSFSVDSSYSFVNGPVFSSCNDSSCLSQYSFFIYSNSCPLNNTRANYFNISYDSSLSLRQFDSLHFYDVFKLPSNISYLQFSGIGGSVNASLLVSSGSDCSISFTLSDHFPFSTPSGSISITENGTYDVSSYVEAVVDVPAQVIQSDYHDDLTTINQSILICGSILLVIYFFYAIYRMIMRGSHGR